MILINKITKGGMKGDYWWWSKYNRNICPADKITNIPTASF